MVYLFIKGVHFFKYNAYCESSRQYLVNGNPYFTLAGATFGVYTDSNYRNPARDTENREIIFTSDANGNCGTVRMWYQNYHNQTLYMKELKTGRGYSIIGNGIKSFTMNVGGGETKYVSMENRPRVDPISMQFVKISDKTGEPVWDGNTRPEGAEYTVKMYALNANGENSGQLLRTSVFRTDANGKVDFEDPSYFVRGEAPLVNPNGNGRYVWTYGYYTIEETQVPTNRYQTGLMRNPSVYKLYYRPNTWSSGGTNATDTYRKLYENDTLVYDQETGYKNPSYYYGGKTPLYTYEQDEDIVRTVEGENWFPLGIFKADMDFAENGYTGNDVLSIPEGNGAYVGAQYQLFTTTTLNEYGQAFFATPSVSNPNGSVILSLGSGISSIATVDGFGTAGTTSFGITLYPVLSDGQPVIITTDVNGYAQTDLKFPYSGEYRFVEVKAPVGYKINTQIQVVTNDWTTGTNGDTLIGLDNYSGHVNAVGIINAHRFGAAEDAIYRYGFAMWKKDLTNSNDTLGNTQGSDSLNGIRFAVINRSDRI